MDFVADSLMKQYWKNNSSTRGIAILSLVEDKIFQSGNQKLLTAAFITYLASGNVLQDDR